MASEHILQLKAVLDTSDVKQKLDNLKGQTQTAGTSGAAGSGSTSGLTAMLRNLNTTLLNLQRTVEKLAVQSKSMNASIKSSNSPLSIAANGKFVNIGNAKSVKDTSLYKQFNKQLNDLISNSSILSKKEIDFLKYRYGAKGKNFTHNLLMSDALAPIGLGRKEYINMQKRYVALHAKSPFMMYPEKTQNSAMQKRIGRQLVTLGAGVVLGGVADYAQASGNKGLATAANWGSNIAMGAGMGAMIGGPIGAGIGAASGALQSAFLMLTESAKEAADALEKQTDRVYKGQDVDNKVQDYLQQREDKAALKKNNLAYFLSEASKEKTFSDNLRKQLEQGEIGFGGKGNEHYKLREYERETLRLMKIRGKDDPEMVRRRDAATMYKANVDVWIKHLSRADEMQDIVDKMKPKASQQQLILNDRMKELQDRLSVMKQPDIGNVNSLASQGFMISRSDDEARLSLQNDYLRDIANMTREIKNIEQQKGEGATYS